MVALFENTKQANNWIPLYYIKAKKRDVPDQLPGRIWGTRNCCEQAEKQNLNFRKKKVDNN